MADPLLHLDKVVTTLKLNMLGEICKVRFVDGVSIKVDSDRFGFRCLGRVTEMDDERIIVYFVAGSEKFKNTRGLNVEISFAHDDEFYYFESEVLEQKDGRTIVISRPDEVKRTQRREYLRLPVKVGVTVRRIDDRNVDSNVIAAFADKVTTKDLSGGGLRFESNDPVNRADGIEVLMDEDIDKNSVVEIDITFSDDEPRRVHALGKIAWINRINDKYEVGVTFLDIQKRDQDFIVKYILNEQIRRSKTQEIKNLNRR